MSMLSITTAGEALKTFFLDSLRYQLNAKASPVLAQLEQNSTSVVGKDIVMPLRYGRNGGFGGGADDGNLPAANSRKTKQAKWETKNLYARIKITDKTMKAAKSNVGAFANLFRLELEDSKEDAQQNLSRQIFADGTGILCAISAVNSGARLLTVPAEAIEIFAEGMLLDVHVANGTYRSTAGSPIEVELVDEVNNQIRVSVFPAGTVATDLLCVQNSYASEITGLKAIFDATTLYGVVRADYPWFNAQSINVAGEISETKIQQGLDDSRRKAGGRINLLACNFGVRRAYQYLLQSQKRQVNTLDLKGGWTGLEYAGGDQRIGLVADMYAPKGSLIGLDTNDFKFYEIQDWDWMDQDGAVLSRIANKPAWEATMIKYGDLGCQKPKAQVRLYGITEH